MLHNLLKKITGPFVAPFLEIGEAFDDPETFRDHPLLDEVANEVDSDDN